MKTMDDGLIVITVAIKFNVLLILMYLKLVFFYAIIFYNKVRWRIINEHL